MSTDATSEEKPGEKPVERLDADGLPLDRPPTIDDVRGNGGLHSRAAIGCTLLIVLLVGAFWGLRALVIR